MPKWPQQGGVLCAENCRWDRCRKVYIAGGTQGSKQRHSTGEALTELRYSVRSRDYSQLPFITCKSRFMLRRPAHPHSYSFSLACGVYPDYLPLQVNLLQLQVCYVWVAQSCCPQDALTLSEHDDASAYEKGSRSGSVCIENVVCF